MRGLLPILLLMCLMAAPMATAQINQADPFDIETDYADVQAGELLIATGKAEATLTRAEGTFVFFDPEDLDVAGLTKVCWSDGSNLPECSTGSVTIRVKDGTSAAFLLPDASDSTFSADFALGLLADFDGSEDAQSLPIGKSMVAPAIGGALDFSRIETIGPIPGEHVDQNGLRDDVGKIVTLSDAGELTITGSNPTTLTGAGQLVTFEGTPVIDAFTANSPLLPFTGQATATFTVAKAAAAREGLDFKRITEMFSNLDDANADKDGKKASDTDAGEGLGGAADLLSEVFNSALVQFPTADDGGDNVPIDEIIIYLYEKATVEAQANGLAWSGAAAFQFKDGGLANAGDQKLYGFTINVPAGDGDVPLPVKLPWWGWALWGVAIALMVTSLVIKAPKRHPTFDRFRWIGIVSSILMLVLVFFLWDLEVRSVWGTSALTTSASGTPLYVTYAVQFFTLFAVLGLLKAPLGIAIKHALRLSKLGNFMGLGGPVSTVGAYLLGALLLLPFLDLILRGVLKSLGGE